MPTYALLGATGKTGNALLTHLLHSPSSSSNNNNIHTYVRSRSKLLRQFPHLNNDESKNVVQIYESGLNDIPTLAECIRGVDVIFSVLGENENTPGMRIAQDAAHSIVAALCHLGCTNNHSERKVPKVIFLSSCTINERMQSDTPALLHWLLMTALSHTYADLIRAEEFLRLHESWLRVTFVQPGGLAEDTGKGHALSLDRKGVPQFVTYTDLAAGMIEIAEAGEYDGMGVSVVSKTDNVKFEWAAPKQILRGLVWHYAPPLGRIAKWVGVF